MDVRPNLFSVWQNFCEPVTYLRRSVSGRDSVKRCLPISVYRTRYLQTDKSVHLITVTFLVDTFGVLFCLGCIAIITVTFLVGTSTSIDDAFNVLFSFFPFSSALLCDTKNQMQSVLQYSNSSVQVIGSILLVICQGQGSCHMLPLSAGKSLALTNHQPFFYQYRETKYNIQFYPINLNQLICEYIVACQVHPM